VGLFGELFDIIIKFVLVSQLEDSLTRRLTWLELQLNYTRVDLMGFDRSIGDLINLKLGF